MVCRSIELEKAVAAESPIVILQSVPASIRRQPPQCVRQLQRPLQNTTAPPHTKNSTSTQQWQLSQLRHHKVRKLVKIHGSRYKITSPLSTTIGEFLHPCKDWWLGKEFTCHICPAATFAEREHLFCLSVEGVLEPVNQFPQGDRVVVIYPPVCGELVAHLQQHGSGLTEATAAAYFRQIVSIVANAHGQSIVLKYLKLKRLVFTDESLSTIKLSSVQDAVVVPSTAKGGDLLDHKSSCPAYIAPEMMQLHRPYSGRAADMWNAGVILYVLLTGRYPFFDLNRIALLLKIHFGSYEIPEHISPSARSLITSLLAHDPAQRPSAKDVLNHPWLRVPPIGILQPCPKTQAGNKKNEDQAIESMT